VRPGCVAHLVPAALRSKAAERRATSTGNLTGARRVSAYARAMRRFALPTAWLALCAQVAPFPQLERLRGFAHLERLDEAAHLRLTANVDVRVVAWRDARLPGPRRRAWRVLIQTPAGTWASREPISEEAADNEDAAQGSHFALRALEARDVMGGHEPEAVVQFHDGRAGDRLSHLVVCSIERAIPRCTAPVAVAAASLDGVFITRGAATTVDEYGAAVELPLELR